MSEDNIDQLEQIDRDELGIIIKINKRNQLNRILNWIKNIYRENIKHIRVRSSSGSSAVFIPETNENVYQWYNSNRLTLRITEIMSLLQGEVTYTFLSKRGIKLLFSVPFTWNIEEYIVKYNYTLLESNMISWEKLITLNSIPNLKYFIYINLNKIVWDLNKSLISIHSKGFIHNDATLDNTGIKNGKFCYFDFDASQEITEDNINKDQKTLNMSIDYYLEQLENVDIDDSVYRVLGGDILKSYIISYLNKQNLVFSEINVKDAYNVLDRLEIIWPDNSNLNLDSTIENSA